MAEAPATRGDFPIQTQPLPGPDSMTWPQGNGGALKCMNGLIIMFNVYLSTVYEAGRDHSKIQ